MHTIAVVVPCYRSRHKVLNVLAAMPAEVDIVFAVDDACPEHTGLFIEERCKDPRVRVIKKEANEGVGGAVLTGYRAAIDAGATVIVKCDSDGQMDPSLIPDLIRPVTEGRADYTKGNRFYFPEDVVAMPRARLLGNAALSFLTKLSTGYWSVFDPTNGFTAISVVALETVPFHKVAKRYFFETDMLFRLGLSKAVVIDIPMKAVYADETSSLRISKVLFEFMGKHMIIAGKRVYYTYFLREFSIATLFLVFGVLFFSFGSLFGAAKWFESMATGTAATSGTVMLSGVPLILGFQMLMAFLSHDYAIVPRVPVRRQH